MLFFVSQDLASLSSFLSCVEYQLQRTLVGWLRWQHPATLLNIDNISSPAQLTKVSKTVCLWLPVPSHEMNNALVLFHGCRSWEYGSVNKFLAVQAEFRLQALGRQSQEGRPLAHCLGDLVYSVRESVSKKKKKVG